VQNLHWNHLSPPSWPNVSSSFHFVTTVQQKLFWDDHVTTYILRAKRSENETAAAPKPGTMSLSRGKFFVSELLVERLLPNSRCEYDNGALRRICPCHSPKRNV
jgi:hypothetical protein